MPSEKLGGEKPKLAKEILSEAGHEMITELFGTLLTRREYRRETALAYPDNKRLLRMWINNSRHELETQVIDNIKRKVAFTKFLNGTNIKEKLYICASEVKTSIDNTVRYQKWDGEHLLIDEENTQEAINFGKMLVFGIPKGKLVKKKRV